MNVFKAFKLSAIAAVLVCTASAAFAAESEFSYAGYLRVGYAYTNGLYGYDGNFGLSGKDGGSQKWTGRLGKEANAQYLENTFMNTFTVEGGAWAKLFVTLTCESFNPGTDAQACTVTAKAPGISEIMMRNRQAYVEMGGLGFAPDSSFWVGRRFYHRTDIHILDYYILDYSGDGAGVENIAGKGVSLAVMSHPYIKDGERVIKDQVSKESDGDAAGKDTCTTGVFQYKNKLVRVDATYAYRPKQGSGAGKEARNGSSLSVEYTPEKFFYFLNGTSSIVAQYGRGATAENIWWGNRYTNMSDQSKHTNKYAYAYTVIASGLIAISDEIQISAVAGYVDLHSVASRIVAAGTGTGDASRLFIVARPHYNINKNIAVEVEGGFYRLALSHTQLKGGVASAAWNDALCGLNDGQKSNWAMKLTPALVITLDNGFWTRPALRLFGQYEQIGKKNTSSVVTSNTTRCISYGFQVEAWW